MSDDSNNTGNTPDSGSKPAGHDDLKARLGLNITAAKPAAAAPAPAAPVESRQPVTAGAAVGEPVDVDSSEKGGKKISPALIMMIVAIGLAALVLGTIVGNVFSQRAIVNSQVDEANHLLEYFATTEIEATGGGLVLDVVSKHVEDTKRVFEMMNKANPDDPEQVSKARTELDAYVKRAQKYYEVQPFFTVDRALYGVVFNPEVSYEVVKFIEAVRRLHDETSLLAYEGATLDQVSSLEKADPSTPSIMFIKPVTRENGEKWNTGTWVSFMKGKPSEKSAEGVDYGLNDIVTGEAFRASTTSLVEFDMGPIAMLESEVYKQSIFLRVKSRLGNVVKAAEEVDYKSLEEKLKEQSGASRLFTFF